MAVTDAPRALGAQPRTPARPRGDGMRRRAPLLPALVFLVVVTQIPFLCTIVFSFRSWNLLRPDSGRWVWFDNYRAVFTDSTALQALGNEVLMTLVSVVLALVLGTLFALLLDRKFPGRGVVRTLMISPFLIMPTVAALLWKTTMLDPVYGLLNYVVRSFGGQPVDFVSSYPMTSLIAVQVWQWTPFMMLICLAGLQSQSHEVLEAAAMDGAGAVRTFFSVTLPHLRSYLELGALLGAIYLINAFDLIYMMTQGGPGTSTTNLPYYIYQRAFQGFDIGQASALGVVTVIGTLIVASVALRTLFSVFRTAERRV